MKTRQKNRSVLLATMLVLTVLASQAFAVTLFANSPADGTEPMSATKGDSIDESSVKATASGDVVINETNFPDEIFRVHVRQYDTDNDGTLQESELSVVTKMNGNDKGIADMTGIEHFTSLTHLYCSSNQLTELDVSDLTHLRWLWCYSNQLTELNISNLTDLTSFDCGHNQLTELDVTDLISLKYFLCNSNNLTNLDTSSLNNLIEFYCGSNQLTELNVANLTNLTKLSCFNNHLTGLDLSACTKLQQLTTCPQTTSTVLAVKDGDQYTINLGNLTDVDIENILEVTLADGQPLPNGYSYDAGNGILTIGAEMELVKLRYLYDTKANLDNIDAQPYMEVYFKPEILTGWVEEAGEWYFYDETGEKVTGWLLDNGRWYFLNRSSGIMQTGWLFDSGKWFFLNRSSGIMQTGWLLDSGKWYFLNRSSGAMKTGWLLDGGKWYFLDRKSGVMKTGWVLDDGKWYLFDSNGVYIRSG